MKAEQKRKLFKEFLEKNKVLISDKSSASRRRLMKTLVDMGCKRNQIFSVAHYAEAMEVITNEKPKLVLSDFKVNGGSGFDLFKEYREQNKKLDDTTLVLITSNISQSAVAKAAEEDVDSFIIKPYTVKSLEKSLINAVITKLYPSEYMKTIDAGKDLMFEGKYQESLDMFAKAIPMSKQPALALFYHGQAKYFLEASEEAEGDYKKGLSYNNIHFKCQVGLYELFMKEKKIFEAYDVVRNIAKYFPSNPDRLQEVIRLAVQTENYIDLEEYYEIFLELEERTPAVVNYMCSGLYVVGKYYFFKNDKAKAKDVYEKMSVSCQGIPKFLKAIIIELAKNTEYDLAKDVFKRFPSDGEDQSAYMIAKFLAHLGDMNNNEKVSGGLELYNNGHKDPYAAKILIDALIADGSTKKAEEYLDEAQQTWPDIFPRIPEAA